MAAIPFNLSNHPTRVVLDLFFTRSIGSRAAIGRFQKNALHCGITTEFCSCNKSFVFTNSEMACSTRVDVLDTGNVPFLFSLPQMKNLGMTIELDPK